MGEQPGLSEKEIDAENTIKDSTVTTMKKCGNQQNAEGDQQKTTGADSSSDEWQHLDNTVPDEAFSSLGCPVNKDLEDTVPDDSPKSLVEGNTTTGNTPTCGDTETKKTGDTTKEGSQLGDDEAFFFHVDEGEPPATSFSSENKDVDKGNSSPNHEGLDEEVNLLDSEEKWTNAEEDSETHEPENNNVDDNQVDEEIAEETNDNGFQHNSEEESSDIQNNGNNGEEDNSQCDEDDEDTKSVSSTDSNYFLKTWRYLPEDEDIAAGNEMDLKFDDQAIEDLEANVDDMDDESPSRLEWLRQKRLLAGLQLSKNEQRLERLMDRVMCLIGQENVKAQFLALKARIEADKSRGEDFKNAHHDIIITGSIGAGQCISGIA
ncbi:uncharacterized protein BO88DRAFT_481225 [Aspergillus vadensis CBS 113365]|uniref:Uncharacterized protein n=1 Tax=Aspergillus vadensis (strain CBS 113365 / IMI 142717 / IBT 24658) TaxID=1448311 RepID=A0A319BAC3_ASPVC|nr:hypothetical protein BO88DRAFT_481225 [Aspergillus vadensis CBS 113365]PYH69896.1 hypothetical protein BO88DRAFT_481225 [Aspergillus vadensis CBS 113365]